MEVKINIESSQIGDTVIDLFKNLSLEKKEELAFTILKEWLQAPEFFETKNKEQLLIEEFRTGARSPRWSSTKYDMETPEYKIKQDDSYINAIKDYKHSKQILVEDIKNEMVSYYKKYIAEQIADHDLINRIKEETYKEIATMFPSIINQVMIQVFSNNLIGMQSQIQDATMKSQWALSLSESIKGKLNL